MYTVEDSVLLPPTNNLGVVFPHVWCLGDSDVE